MNNQTEPNAPMVDPSDNLEELVNRMNKQQQLNFKKAVVRQTIDYVSQCLPTKENDQGERWFIDIAHRWLEEPTDERAEKASLAVAADYIDGGMRYFDYPAYFLEPALAAGASAYGASRHALAAAEAASLTAHQWQMNVAWAIVNNEDIPPLNMSQ